MARCGFQKAWTRIQVTAQRRCLPMKHANKADYGSKVDLYHGKKVATRKLLCLNLQLVVTKTVK